MSELGSLKKKFSIYVGEKPSSLEVYSDGVVARVGKTINAKNNYIQRFEKMADMALNKCEVQMTYYDLFGNLDKANFIMNRDDYRAAKAMLGK